MVFVNDIFFKKCQSLLFNFALNATSKEEDEVSYWRERWKN